MLKRLDAVRMFTHAAQVIMALEDEQIDKKSYLWGTYYSVIVTPEALPEIARTLAPVQKFYRDGKLSLRKMLEGGGYIAFYTDGPSICKAIEIKKTWVHEEPAREGYYKEEIVWDCPSDESLLAPGATDADTSARE